MFNYLNLLEIKYDNQKKGSQTEVVHSIFQIHQAHVIKDLNLWRLITFESEVLCCAVYATRCQVI